MASGDAARHSLMIVDDIPVTWELPAPQSEAAGLAILLPAVGQEKEGVMPFLHDLAGDAVSPRPGRGRVRRGQLRSLAARGTRLRVTPRTSGRGSSAPTAATSGRSSARRRSMPCG
jgi:hypothetical protein